MTLVGGMLPLPEIETGVLTARQWRHYTESRPLRYCSLCGDAPSIQWEAGERESDDDLRLCAYCWARALCNGREPNQQYNGDEGGW